VVVSAAVRYAPAAEDPACMAVVLSVAALYAPAAEDRGRIVVGSLWVSGIETPSCPQK